MAGAPPKSRRLKRWFPILLFLAAPVAFTPTAGAAGAEAGPSEELVPRVLILANSAAPDSLRVARHYAAARGVPTGNIIALPMPTDETITWRQFVPQIWEPLMARLVRDRWIEAIPMDLIDPVGRRKYAILGQRIAALVVCRGVPLRIENDPSLYADVPPYTTHGEFRTNQGAVDAELSLLAMPNHPINAFVPNSLFQNEHPTSFQDPPVVKVSRLDGPTVDDAMALVDRALVAERDGLLGRAYIDIGDRDPIGNRWLESAATQLAQLDFDTTIDREPATFPATARMDAPVLYFGWYAQDLNGPFALPGFRFPPGAIALHIHSYSATTLRSTTSGWTGPLVARGVTATVGNVYEPYLQLTHRPDLLLRALARGADWVDAGYFALQALSWQEVLIGDPLYRPFAVPLDVQLVRLREVSPRRAGYAVLRRMHQLDKRGRRVEATALLRRTQGERPTLAVGLALAQRLHAAGNDSEAATALEFAAGQRSFAPDDWAVAREAAQMLATCGRPTLAVDVWRALLADASLPSALREPWLRDAIGAALAAQDTTQADAWKTEADAAGNTGG